MMRIFWQQKWLVLIVSCVCVFAESSRQAGNRNIPTVDKTHQDSQRQENTAKRVGLRPQSQIEAVGPMDRRVIAGGGGTSSAGSPRVDGTRREASASKTRSGGTSTPD